MSVSFVFGFFPTGVTSYLSSTEKSPPKILMIGDSHSTIYSYGSSLHKLLSDAGAQVQSYAVGATTPLQWADDDYSIPKKFFDNSKMYIIDENGKKSTSLELQGLSPLKEEFDPNIIIISLGTNVIGQTGDDRKLRIKKANELAKMASQDSKCFWVGPPKTTDPKLQPELDKTVQEIKDAVSPLFCTFIDSTSLSDETKLSTDKIHYTTEGGKDWAQKVFDQIKPQIDFGTSTTKMVSNNPTSSTSTQKILFIGDSHVPGPYGKELASLLKQAGNTVETYGCVGASPFWFYTDGHKCSQGSTFKSETAVQDYDLPRLSQLLLDTRPSVVLVSLGANMFGSSSENIKLQSKQLVDIILTQGAKCIWVGPKFGPTTTYDEAGEIFNSIKGATDGKCQMIDSRDLLKFNFCGDKQCCCPEKNTHLTAYGAAGATAGKEWAKNVFQQLDLGSLPTQSSRLPSTSTTSPSTISPSTTSTTSYQKVIKDVPGCLNPTRCREIDEAWSVKVSPFIGVGVNQVWDHQTNSWKKYDDLYIELKAIAGKPITSPSIQPATITKPSSSGNEYNQFIKEAATTFSVEPEFIKALMKYESNFNPSIVSSTGCKGLMQVCSWESTEKYQELRTQYSLSENYDDPKSNIFIGAYILKAKINSVKNCGNEKAKAVIAAYNAGELFVNKAIDANSGNCDNWQDVWNKMNENFDESSNSLFGIEKTWLTRSKIDGLSNNGYVGKVYNLYQSYKKYGIEGTDKGATIS